MHHEHQQAFIAVLNNLIETCKHSWGLCECMSTTFATTRPGVMVESPQPCKDGENGFRAAAEGATNSELKALFRSYALQRALYAAELQSEVRRLGGDPENRGSLAATLHRGWINIKSVVTGQDESAIIAECERGEDGARSNYQEALQEDLPADVRALLERQYASVKEAHDRIRALEVAASHA